MGNEGRMPQIEDPRLTSALGEARTAYVAVDAATGPHVTPELYAWSEGRLCFAAASNTLKAKVLSKRPLAAVVVRSGGATVLLAGEVVRPDPITAARWMAGFVVRNAPDLLGFAADLVQGKAGSRIPSPRVVYGLVPDRAAIVEGDTVVASWGDWAGAEAPGDDEGPSGVPAVLGWDTEAGPLAVPVRWDADACRAWASPEVVGLAGLAGSARAAVVADDYGRPGPAGKTGVLLRGEAAFDGCVARFDTERITAWDGVETRTESA